MAFMTNLAPRDLRHLVHLMLRGTIPKYLQLAAVATRDPLRLTGEKSSSGLSLPAIDSARWLTMAEVSSEWHDSVEELVRDMSAENMADVAWERQVGFLHLMEDMVKIIGLGVKDYVGIMFRTVTLMLSYAQHVRSSIMATSRIALLAEDGSTKEKTDTYSLSVDMEIEDNEDAHDEDEEVGDEENQSATFIFSQEIKDANQSVRVRSLCLLRLSGRDRGPFISYSITYVSSSRTRRNGSPVPRHIRFCFCDIGFTDPPPTPGGCPSAIPGWLFSAPSCASLDQSMCFL